MRKLVILVTFCVLAAIWFWREIFGGFLFCFSDLNFYFYPYRHFMAESIRQGIFPLWNPYISCGFPFLATLQPAAFYPLSLLYYFLPFDLAFNWFLVIHFPLGAFFMYLLCRYYKLSGQAALAAGLTFGFSGYLFSVMHMPTTLASVIWLPLVVLAWKKILTEPQIHSQVPILAILLAIMFLGGEPTVLYGTFWLLLVDLIFVRWGQWRQLTKSFLALVLAFLLAGLLTAIQLFPFLELLAHSSRAGGISFNEASHFSLQLKDLLELIIPFFAHLTIYPWVAMSWAKFAYLGVIPLALVLVGLYINKDKLIWWLGAAMLFIVLVVLGSNAPVYYFLFKYVPGFNLFRYPVKFLFILVFIFSYLVGLGIDLISKAEAKTTKRVLIWLSAAAAFLSAAFFWASWQTQQAFELLRPLFSEEIRQGFLAHLKTVTLPRDIANLGFIVLLILLLLVTLLLYLAGKISRPVFCWGLVGLILLDLMTANLSNNFSAPAILYAGSVPANIRLLQSDKSVFRYLVSPDLTIRSHYETSNEFSNYQQAVLAMRNRLTSNQGMLYGLSDVDGYESIRGADQEKLIRKIWALNSLAGVRILDLLNIKYLAVSFPFRQAGFKLLSVSDDTFKNGRVLLYQNQNHLPRQYRVSRVKVISDRDRALGYLFSRSFDPRREVVLQEKVKSPGGFWFESEWFYPGWRAYVDGKETPIYRANFMFRAVPLPPGQHTVKFVYAPWTFKIGAWVSLVTLLGMIVALILNFRYTKNREKMENFPA